MKKKKILATITAIILTIILAVNINISHGTSEQYGKSDLQIKWQDTELIYLESAQDYTLFETPFFTMG